ncbi:MGH1-like glycoside hydrolase domain-containing protein [Rubritalea marina]|uniref:MGH1-like glycoside hydrolase domain-containing protein n=1 Tax=Rubritalea marina TaxID=361055 RepID=UPI0003627FEF|nr:glycosyl hydrolase family 65 protein [Rubritalea marina]
MKCIYRFFLAAALTNYLSASPDPALLKSYVEGFNADDEELYAHIPNAQAYDFLEKNIPLFECSDKAFEKTYYFRWWTYRKHVRQTPDGYVITEFLPDVSWAGKHNTISCPGAHLYREGRWLRNPQYLDDYSIFWLRKGGSPRSYSFWIADSILQQHMVHPNPALLKELLPDLQQNYAAWERSHRKHGPLFFQRADRDGMECAIGGDGYRPTINSYMIGDAMAIAEIADMAGEVELAKGFRGKAKTIKQSMLEQLWDPEAQFFKVLRQGEQQLVNVRELHGLTPWYFNIPEDKPEFSAAWKQVMDPEGFFAPFGPTSAEQRHPQFSLSYHGHECQWNGPSWPFATSITLTGMANLLNNYQQNAVNRADYYTLLDIYTKSHTRTREDGKVVPWIDENLHPFNGDWISRTRLKQWKNGTWSAQKGGKERGKDYNHSTYNDLLITGLIGLRPSLDNSFTIQPLLPETQWSYFSINKLPYKGKLLTITWDASGETYGKGKGLFLYVDGTLAAQAPSLQKLTAELE